MGEVGTRATGVVIPFAPTIERRVRAPADGEARGEILLFTGVRYQRLTEPLPEPSPVFDGRSGSGRRRRRS